MAMSEAIIVLPPAAFGRIADHRLRAWLSRGKVAFGIPSFGPLESIITDFDAPWTEDDGRAAWRYLGQTGRRPDGWIAGADPVFLRPRMRDIVVEALPPETLPEADVAAVFDSLVQGFQDVDGVRFEHIDSRGYLVSESPFASSGFMAESMHGRVPDAIKPSGGSFRYYQRINTEIQMLLHDHPVNLSRQERGLPAINALWLWGGGELEDGGNFSLPPLFADDPLFSGYWLARGNEPQAWPGDLSACCESSDGVFVAVPSEDFARFPDPWLSELRSLMSGGRIQRATIEFRDELYAKLSRRDRFRFWRPVAVELQEKDVSE